MTPYARLTPILVAALLGLSLLTPPVLGAELDLEEADLRLAHLKDQLSSSKSLNDDLLDALDQVEASALGLQRDVTPETEKAFAKWRTAAEKAYLKAFVLVKPDRRAKDRNLRDEVNLRAAQIIGRTGNVALWKDVKRGLETRHFKAKHRVPQELLEGAFDAIAALGDPKALAWMADEFIHTNSSPQKAVDRLVAAQRAMVKFPLERLSGAQRHAVFKKLVTLYPATETVARQNSNTAAAQSTRRFWDRIRTGVIRAAQHFSGMPRNEDGEALATMQEFSEWFRDHKDARRAPWTGWA